MSFPVTRSTDTIRCAASKALSTCFESPKLHPWSLLLKGVRRMKHNGDSRRLELHGDVELQYGGVNTGSQLASSLQQNYTVIIGSAPAPYYASVIAMYLALSNRYSDDVILHRLLQRFYHVKNGAENRWQKWEITDFEPWCTALKRFNQHRRGLSGKRGSLCLH